MKNIIAFSIILCAASLIHAQLLPSRNMFPDLRADSGRTSGFLTRTKFYGEMMRGFGSAGDDRAWDATIGGFAEIYRWSENAALRIHFAQDMLANSLTHDIHFKPRSMQYEENISGTFHTSTFDWEAGLTYRCKHDIDNTDDPASSITPPVDSATQKRVIILGGIYGLVAPDPIVLTGALTLKSSARLDLYAIHEDNRFPNNADGMLWSNVWSSVTLGARLDLACSSLTSVYTLDWVTALVAHGNGQNVNANGHIEAGLHFSGVAGGMDAFISYEHLFDDLSIPEPRSSNTVSVGLRVN
ncbi:MAG TPA: hypothetical protein VFA55_07770 [Candidatus Kapabacteria bacterium]|nr:hypothetical protein [Candidatus Kapabacteria bacterium]